MSAEISHSEALPGVLGCLQRIEDALAAAGERGLHFLTTSQKRDALRQLTAVSSRLEALRLAMIAAAGDVAEVEAHRDVATWLAHHTRADRRAAARSERLAHALDRRWTLLAAALADGAVNLEQAQVIANALDQLPHSLDPDVVRRAEAHLIEQAADFGPHELRILGRRVLDVIAPEIGEDHERRLLEAEERRAERATRLTTHRLGDGTTRLLAVLPDPAADRLLTYLEAFTSPRRSPDPAHSVLPPEDRRPYESRLGHAFCAFLETVDPARLPLHGGDATTLVITLDHQTLLDGLGTAALADGSPITAGEARRLACTAGLLPMVLGGRSEILDLGRTSRLFTPAQRKALAARDRVCRAAGCALPAPWCEAHHAREPWAHGGHTDLDDGLLLCRHHHQRAHDDRYLHTTLPNGDIRFHRRR